MYKAKRNVMFGGKLYEKGKEYELTEEELKQIGVDFEAPKNAKPVKDAPKEAPKEEPKEEETPNEDEGDEEAQESEKPKKAKRK